MNGVHFLVYDLEQGKKAALRKTTDKYVKFLDGTDKVVDKVEASVKLTAAVVESTAKLVNPTGKLVGAVIETGANILVGAGAHVVDSGVKVINNVLTGAYVDSQTKASITNGVAEIFVNVKKLNKNKDNNKTYSALKSSELL